MGVQVTARQLHLFKSRRQRGTLPPAPSEYQLHCAVVDTVKRWIMPGWIFTHIASGEKRDPVTAARLKRMEVTAGFPDQRSLARMARCVLSRRRQVLRRVLRRLGLRRPRILRQLAALDGGGAHRTGRFGLRGKGIGKGAVGEARLHISAAAGKANRQQRQHRDLRHPTRAKQLGDTGHGYHSYATKYCFE